MLGDSGVSSGRSQGREEANTHAVQLWRMATAPVPCREEEEDQCKPKSHPSLQALFIEAIQRLIPTEGTASLENNRLKTLRHARTLFSGFQRHGST
eukprot:4658618-Pyramimonas_sp.AAC.1